MAAVRAALGDRAFAAEWAAGEGMGLDDVVACAVGTSESATRTAPGGPTPEVPAAARLSPREREVAALIARGLSNREIAEHLVIAERTATNHVEHIFAKLGLRSRTQVAVWAMEQRLAGARR